MLIYVWEVPKTIKNNYKMLTLARLPSTYRHLIHTNSPPIWYLMHLYNQHNLLTYKNERISIVHGGQSKTPV